MIRLLFVSMLVASLACSASLRYGHADSPVAATAGAIKPLQAGEKAPHFVVRSPDHEVFDFDPRELERAAVIVMFRGGWCMYCNLHLSELRHVVPEIHESGVDVLFLSGDRPELLLESLGAETREAIDGLDYRIYSDADASAATAFGIAFRASDRTINRRRDKGDDIRQSSMARHGVLPVPSVYAVDRNGDIAFAYNNADYKVRVPADELLAVAKRLVASTH